MVTGTHFSAIFIDRDDAYNDVFNNIVTGATDFSIEIHSSKPNLFEDNLEDIPELRLGN